MSPTAVVRMWCFGTLLVLSCAGQQPPESLEKSSVAGKVVSATSGEPLRKVNIYLVSNDAKSRRSYVAVSDAEGHFSIENVDPGSYRLKGERIGYLPGELGAKGGREKGSELQLAAGEKLDALRLELVPQGAISGRVVDQDGDPWTAGSAGLSRLVWRRGKLRLEGFTGTGLDDRGEFRIAGLPPGRYFAAISPDQNGEHADAVPSSKTRPEREQETWYSGTLDPHSATPLLLRAGQEITGIEIRVKKSPVFRIAGKVTGLPAERDTGRFLAPGLAAIPEFEEGPYHRGVLRPDGSFEIQRVPPGDYAVRIHQSSDSFLSWAQAWLGQANVLVTDQDVDDVVIELIPPRRLEGRVRIEGNDQVKLPQLSVGLSQPDGDSFVRGASLKDDGSFAFELLGAGRYDVKVSSDAADLYLKSIRLGETESKDGMLDLTRDKNSKVELLLSTRGAQIQGTVRADDASKDALSAKDWHVWLIPDTSDLEQRERRAQAGVFNQSGAFTLRNIAPGSYTLYAWQDLPDDIWKNPDFLAEVKGKGIDISLGEGDRKQIEAPLIPSSATPALRTKLGID